ncbi:hypothetical protein [Lacrimispora sp. 210928-DFI.3.58]|uniref:hypothetical protein n=1 Tax=Lacrimispora sp. 210928-DFI.3.58 TaxID=2883214 RepID=UPI001D069177|nr:hypothetical protein [Lacrimispora sp. 210928-DFI.3.58]MCB7317552.1 hypothetical protein [Lacrimispora sp. 210928-DFI.3.58]
MYEVHCNYGSSLFRDEEDALNALWMVGLYHGISIDREQVKRELEGKSYYENFPISIVKAEY